LPLGPFVPLPLPFKWGIPHVHLLVTEGGLSLGRAALDTSIQAGLVDAGIGNQKNVALSLHHGFAAGSSIRTTAMAGRVGFSEKLSLF
jgi:hypothetical protein